MADEDDDNRNPGRLPPGAGEAVQDSERLPPGIRDALRKQLTPAVIEQTRRSARKRVQLLRRAGHLVDSQYHHDVVQDAIEGTLRGALRWVPEEESLLDHLRDAVWQRVSNEMRKGPDGHVSLQAASDERRPRVEAEITAAQASRRGPDPVRLESLTEEVVTALRPLVGHAPDADEVLKCWEAGVTDRTEAMARTGFSAARYHAARKRLLYIAKGLPSRLRQAVQELLRSDE